MMTMHSGVIPVSLSEDHFYTTQEQKHTFACIKVLSYSRRPQRGYENDLRRVLRQVIHLKWGEEKLEIE